MATFSIPEARTTTEIASHRIEKSIDSGETFVAQITIPYDPTDPLTYNQSTRAVFWVDPTPVAAEIVRTTAIHADATEDPYAYVYATPAETAMCNVYGCVTDAIRGSALANSALLGGKVGNMDGIRIEVAARDKSLAKWKPNTGVSGLSAQTQLVVERKTSIYTDVNGNWQVNLIPGMEVQILIHEARLGLRLRVPNIATLNFRDGSKYRIPMSSQTDASWSVLSLFTFI